MLAHDQLSQHRQPPRPAGAASERHGRIERSRRGEADHAGLVVHHDGERILERVPAVGQHAVGIHVHRREHRRAAHLAHAHERALEVGRVGEPVEEERVELLAIAGAGGTGVLVAVLVERAFAGGIEGEAARADLHQHVLGLQLARQGQARAHDLRRAEAQRIAHRLRLHKVGEFEIVFHVEPLPGQYNGNRRGQHEHVLVKTKRDIGHGEFLSSGDP